MIFPRPNKTSQSFGFNTKVSTSRWCPRLGRAQYDGGGCPLSPITKMPFTKALLPSARHVLLASNTRECFCCMKVVRSADGVLPQLWAHTSVNRLYVAWLIVKSYSEVARRVPSNVDLSAGRQEPVPYKRLFRLSFYLLGYLMLRGRVFF